MVKVRGLGINELSSLHNLRAHRKVRGVGILPLPILED